MSEEKQKIEPTKEVLDQQPEKHSGSLVATTNMQLGSASASQAGKIKPLFLSNGNHEEIELHPQDSVSLDSRRIPYISVRNSSSTYYNNQYIAELQVEGYTLLRKMPVSLEKVDGGTWIAKFEKANIGMSGNSIADAKEALAYDIVDTFKLYNDEEENLIPKLKGYLDVLRDYIKSCEPWVL